MAASPVWTGVSLRRSDLGNRVFNPIVKWVWLIEPRSILLNPSPPNVLIRIQCSGLCPRNRQPIGSHSRGGAATHTASDDRLPSGTDYRHRRLLFDGAAVSIHRVVDSGGPPHSTRASPYSLQAWAASCVWASRSTSSRRLSATIGVVDRVASSSNFTSRKSRSNESRFGPTRRTIPCSSMATMIGTAADRKTLIGSCRMGQSNFFHCAKSRQRSACCSCVTPRTASRPSVHPFRVASCQTGTCFAATSSPGGKLNQQNFLASIVRQRYRFSIGNGWQREIWMPLPDARTVCVGMRTSLQDEHCCQPKRFHVRLPHDWVPSYQKPYVRLSSLPVRQAFEPDPVSLE